MLSAYDIIPFDNVNGGKWKQGFEITYDAEKIKQGKPLQVVLVPHSHNDPGNHRFFDKPQFLRLVVHVWRLFPDVYQLDLELNVETFERKAGYDVYLRGELFFGTMVVAAERRE